MFMSWSTLNCFSASTDIPASGSAPRAELPAAIAANTTKHGDFNFFRKV